MKTQHHVTRKRLSRRQLLYTLGSSIAGLAGALLLRKKFDELNSYIAIGPVETFKPGSVTTFEKEHFHLVRLIDGGFLALSRVCTHLRCAVPWVESEKQFVCPCHRSKYDIKGDLLSPPASRGLDIHKLKIKNKIVMVSLGAPIKRGRFEHSQLTYPSQRKVSS